MEYILLPSEEGLHIVTGNLHVSVCQDFIDLFGWHVALDNAISIAVSHLAN
jgi:hypothetical protein